MGKGTQTTYSVIPAYEKAIDDLGNTINFFQTLRVY